MLYQNLTIDLDKLRCEIENGSNLQTRNLQILVAYLRENPKQNLFLKGHKYEFTYQDPDNVGSNCVYVLSTSQNLIVRYNDDDLRAQTGPVKIKLNPFDPNDPETELKQSGLNGKIYLSRSHFKITTSKIVNHHERKNPEAYQDFELTAINKPRIIKTFARYPHESELAFRQRMERVAKYNKRYIAGGDNFSDHNYQIAYIKDKAGEIRKALFCMKYLDGLSLKDAVNTGLIDELTVNERLQLAEDITNILQWLADDQVVHGDITFGNLIFYARKQIKRFSKPVKQPRIVLIDYEMASNKAEREQGFVPGGTPNMCAPEIFSPNAKTLISSKSDISAASFVLAVLLFGRSAITTDYKGSIKIPITNFNDARKHKLSLFFEHGKLEPAQRYRYRFNANSVDKRLYGPTLTKRLIKLLKDMQQFDPEKRPSAKDIHNELMACQEQIATQSPPKKKRRFLTKLRLSV